VLDAEGSVLHRRELGELRANGVAWLGDTIATIARGWVPVSVECYAVVADGIAAPFDRELDLPPGVGAVVIQGSAHGDLLVITSHTTRDVGVLALADGDTHEPGQLSPGLEAHNNLPAWLDDDRLVYVSDRFGDHGVIIDHREGRRARPDTRFEGNTIACAVAGTAVLCVIEERERNGWIVRIDGEGPARRLAPTRGLEMIECSDASTCIGLVRLDDTEATIHAIDPERGTLTRRFVCPRELKCEADRIAIARDGRSLLLVDDQRVHRIDIVTGAEVAPPLVAAEGDASVESASELPGGDIVVTDMLRPREGPVYRVVRFHDGVPTVLWRDDERWFIRPRVSPDGRHLALTTMAYHHEAAIAKDPCRVGARAMD
jgi:hypothetical protein